MAFTSRTKRSAELRQIELDRETELIKRTKENDIEGVKELLDDGVNVDAAEYNRFLFYKSQNYMTPLQIAAREGYTELVKLFIEYEDEEGSKANLDAKDRFDTTAVHLAAEFGRVECLHLLLDAGADCNVATKDSKQGSYSVRYVGGTTPLHLATTRQHKDCVNELILNGADYNAVDVQGRTSLYIAAELGCPDIVLAHLHNAVGRDILSLPVVSTGETPLHQCVSQGLLECVEELLKHGSDVNHQNLSGYSALHMSLMGKDGSTSSDTDFKMLRTLVLKGFQADVNGKDKAGVHPLQFTCFQDTSRQDRKPHVAAFLIAYGARIDGIRNKHGLGILQAELQSSSPDMTILRAIVKSLARLPPCTEVGVLVSRPPPPPQPAQPQQPQHPPHHLHHLHMHGLVNPPVGVSASSHSIIKQKWNWYQELCRSPRSLQHYCRCVVRGRLLENGRLRETHRLPLPGTLKDYLLLEYDEYR